LESQLFEQINPVLDTFYEKTLTGLELIFPPEFGRKDHLPIAGKHSFHEAQDSILPPLDQWM
jgi:hypothetical protein